MPLNGADSASGVDPGLQQFFNQAQAKYAAMGNSAGSTSSVQSEPNVYLGRWQGDHEAQSPTAGVVTLTAAKQNFYAWSPAEQQAWANKMYRAGLINDPGNYDAALAQWTSAVEFAAGQYTYGQKRITPWDVMQDRLGLSRVAGNGNGPRTTTSTSTARQVLSNGDADTMIKAIFQSQLGRDPDKGELSRYRSMLINKVDANPQVSTTTTNYDGKGNQTSNTVTRGGVNQSELQGMVSDKNQADPEWGAYQAATSYMGALENLLGGSPDLTGGNG